MPASAVAVVAEAKRAAEMRPAPAPMMRGVAMLSAVPTLERAVRGGRSRPNLWRQLELQALSGASKPFLLNQIRQQAKEAGAFDRASELALLLGGDGGDPARHDLASLRNVALQELHVLEIGRADV